MSEKGSCHQFKFQGFLVPLSFPKFFPAMPLKKAEQRDLSRASVTSLTVGACTGG